MSKTPKAFFLTLLFLGLPCKFAFAQSTGKITDARDGQDYKTVTYQLGEREVIKEVTWMAQNLRYKTPDSYCFKSNEVHCKTNGRLYNWFEAMQSCPAGWRLPTDDDWTQLVNLFGGIEKAARHLKANKKAWRKGNGTNKSQFNGMPSGTADRNGFHQEQAGFFWSATLSEETPEEASDWSFVPWLDAMRHWYGGKEIGNAVRCVKN